MKNSPSKIALLAAIVFSFSCSSGDEQNPPANEATKYCVYKEMRTCHSTSQLNCPAGGEMSDFCPYDGSSVASSSPSVAPSSSSACTAANNTLTQYCSNGTMKQYGSVTYEGETYRTVVIGTQTWMAQNLNYNASGSKCYDNNTANCTTYGRLYDWATAMALPASCNSSTCASQISAKHRGICPSGWHIPSNAEWNVLMKFVNPNCSDDSYCAGAGTKLKATSGWNNSGNGTDAYGFSALPGGLGDWGDGFRYVGDFGYWWSASEDYSRYAYLRYVNNYNEVVFWGSDNKGFLQSVRCLQD